MNSSKKEKNKVEVTVFGKLITEVTSCAVFCLLEASYWVQPIFEGRELCKGHEARRAGLTGNHFGSSLILSITLQSMEPLLRIKTWVANVCIQR